MMGTEEFKLLAEDYRDMIFRIAFSLLKSQADAEDVTQEVLLHLYETERVFDGREHIKNWLVKVTYNECCKLWRRPWRWQKRNSKCTWKKMKRKEVHVYAELYFEYKPIS